MTTENQETENHERFKKATREYFESVREYFDGLEKALEHTASALNMNEPVHARAINSQVGVLVEFDIPKRIKEIGRDYEGKVSTLRHVVTHEY